MKIYKLPEKREVSALPEGCAVALGNFDGVHLGHSRLFSEAKASGCPYSCVWSFTSLAKPGLRVPYLTDMSAKLELFAEKGLDYAIFEDFDRVREMTCRDFAEKYIAARLHAGCVVCGFNFRFGKGGTGDAELLRKLLSGCGIKSVIANPVLRHNRIVSSSAVRECVLSGDMECANDLSGHPFSINFPVLHGNQLGRTIGIPTINQDFPEGHIIPRRGIYACTCEVANDIFLGVANVGMRPTVSGGDTRVNCETHIIDYNGLLYGKRIKVSFYKRLRDEIKFAGVDELREQIEKDITACTEYFAAVYGK